MYFAFERFVWGRVAGEGWGLGLRLRRSRRGLGWGDDEGVENGVVAVVLGSGVFGRCGYRVVVVGTGR